MSIVRPGRGAGRGADGGLHADAGGAGPGGGALQGGLAQANASRHLQLLTRLGFVERRKEGLYVHYRLADPEVFQLCDLM